MEGAWDEYEAHTSVDELWSELESIRSGVPGRRPIVRRSLTRGLKIGLGVGGGSVTISQTAGNLRPNHNNYCMDFAVLPPSFTTGVTWSQ